MAVAHLPLTLLRSLTVSAPTGINRPSHLAAASGLVQIADKLYVVADDEYHLGVFSRTEAFTGYMVRLFAGELPDAPADRKAQKPDLEALVVLPAFAAYPQGALFALGSGSKSQRQRGVVVGLDADGNINTTPQIIDLAAVYAAFQTTFADLNIEGAFISGTTLNLLQRCNQAAFTQNALIELHLDTVLNAISSGNAIPATAVRKIRLYDLGKANGVPLGFTDAAALPDGSWVFTAAAEATDSSYQDGVVVGAGIGVVNRAGDIVQFYTLDADYKLEGIAANRQADGKIELLLVTDADDPNTPASLLTASLPH